MGNITQVTVNDDSFPFGYDQTQFDLCLDVPVLQDNLNSICEKVDDDDLQKIILKKLNQVIQSNMCFMTLKWYFKPLGTHVRVALTNVDNVALKNKISVLFQHILWSFSGFPIRSF